MARYSTTQTLQSLVVIGVVAGFSFVPIYYGGLYLQKGHQSESWTSTTALVEQSETIRTPSGDTKTHLNYKFKYRYWVNGKSYTSHRNSYKAGGGDVAEIVNRLKKGDSVQVYYNPNTPSEVVVERGYSLLQIVWIAAGLVGLGFCGLGLVGLWMDPLDRNPHRHASDME